MGRRGWCRQEENKSMLIKWTYYIGIISAVAFLSSGFKSKSEAQEWFRTTADDTLHFNFPSPEPEDYRDNNIPFTGNHFIGYKEALAFRESQGRYNIVNTLGYMGKYQFGKAALRTVGVTQHNKFLHDAPLQERAFMALTAKNKWLLREEIAAFEGKVVGGIRVTESGILAAAHLGGPGSVKRFLRTQGNRHSKDNYGTSIRTYMRKFGGYDTSAIAADAQAHVSNY